jgi:hypothetical protein
MSWPPSPNTTTQIFEVLSLSAPSVHTHQRHAASKLLREEVDWKKAHPAERYNEPNFPVFQTALRKGQSKIEHVSNKTGLAKQVCKLSASRRACLPTCIVARTIRGVQL